MGEVLRNDHLFGCRLAFKCIDRFYDFKIDRWSVKKIYPSLANSSRNPFCLSYHFIAVYTTFTYFLQSDRQIALFRYHRLYCVWFSQVFIVFSKLFHVLFYYLHDGRGFIRHSLFSPVQLIICSHNNFRYNGIWRSNKLVICYHALSLCLVVFKKTS